jgi:hypothetical protein
LCQYPVVVESICREDGIEQCYPKTDTFRFYEIADSTVEDTNGKEKNQMLYKYCYPVTCRYSAQILQYSDYGWIYRSA